jgi:transcriptional regulator with XRE-family HTH domain
MNYLRDIDLLQKFGKRVKKIRLEKGLTQKELALEMDVEISQISRIERGLVNPTLTTLIKLATCLNVKIASFFGERL